MPYSEAELAVAFGVPDTVGGIAVTTLPSPVQQVGHTKLVFLEGDNDPATTLPINFSQDTASDLTETSQHGMAPDLPLSGIESVRSACGFIGQTFTSAGRDHAYPLWFHTLSIATFFGEPGRALAHAMSKGHKDYTQKDTDAKFTAKLKDRQVRNPGWPRCATIERDGCKSCATCPLKGKIIHPLDIVKLNLQSQKQHIFISGIGNVSIPLPHGYNLDKNNCITFTYKNKDEEISLPLFRQPVFDPYAMDEPRSLFFKTIADGGRVREVVLEAGEIASGLCKKLAEQFVTVAVFGRFREQVEMFMASWLAEVEKAKTSPRRRVFGWDTEGEPGFSYGGTIYMPDDTEVKAGGMDPEIARSFTPKGNLDEWIKFGKEIVHPLNNPKTELLLAASFAAPLVKFSGEHGGMIFARGLSGRGKSTMCKYALAAWGNPMSGLIQMHSTPLSTLHKMGKRGNIPVYWDDIKDQKQLQSIPTLAMEIHGGVEKGRMLDGHTLQRAGRWSSIAVGTSNHSVYGILTDLSRITDAAHNRILEFEYTSPDFTVPETRVAQWIERLELHYGRAGEKYAKHIAAQSRDYFLKRFEEETELFKVRTNVRGERVASERIWRALGAAIIIGAQEAKKIGLYDFRVQALTRLLDEIIIDCRKQIISEFDVQRNVEEYLAGFIGQYAHQEIVVNNTPEGFRDIHMPIKLLYTAPLSSSASQKVRVSIRWVAQRNMVQLCTKSFREYLTKTRGPLAEVREVFTKVFKMEQPSVRMGKGLGKEFSSPPEHVYELHFEEGSKWWEHMHQLIDNPKSLTFAPQPGKTDGTS